MSEDQEVETHNNPKAGHKAIISSVCWVNRGYAKAVLEEYTPDEKDMIKAKNITKKAMKDKIGETEKKIEIDDDMADAEDQNVAEYGEEESDDSGSMPIFTSELARLKQKETGKPMHHVGADDEKVELDADEDMEVNNDEYPSEYSDSEEEKDDFTVRKTDSLIVAATAEDDFSNLEVYIYDHKTQDLYVHHEIVLGALPLCLEWLNTWQGEKTNHIIVGTFLPEIEIWNLDSENCEPTAILGSLEKSEAHKANKK